MSVVVTFEGYTPPPRFDEVPWTQATIEEAPATSGPWTLIETVTLDPVDSDPADPAERDLTTDAGTTVDLWYRITFLDGAGNQSTPTAPLLNSNVVLFGTVAELAAILKVNATSNADALERVLVSAGGEIVSEIGRSSLSGWELALAEEVNLERAVEHWQQMKSPFGVLGLGAEFGATHTARDSWDRHAHKLAPLKVEWGVA